MVWGGMIRLGMAVVILAAITSCGSRTSERFLSVETHLNNNRDKDLILLVIVNSSETMESPTDHWYEKFPLIREEGESLTFERIGAIGGNELRMEVVVEPFTWTKVEIGIYGSSGDKIIRTVFWDGRKW